MPHARRAFSIIELVVVVSILLSLTAIVLPSLAESRRRAESTRCLANLRSLAASAAAYQREDRAGMLIPVHPTAETNLRHDDGFFDYGGCDGDPGVVDGSYGPGGARASSTRPMNAFVSPDPTDQTALRRAFECPRDRGLESISKTELYDVPLDLVGRPTIGAVGTSYHANARRTGGWARVPPTGEIKSISVFLRRAGAIPAPAETALFYDAVWYTATHSTGLPERPRTWGVKVLDVPGWHGGRRHNFAFCDGHAAEITMQPGQAARPDPEADPLGYMYWYRVSGVRSDCRPAPPILDVPFTPRAGR